MSKVYLIAWRSNYCILVTGGHCQPVCADKSAITTTQRPFYLALVFFAFCALFYIFQDFKFHFWYRVAPSLPAQTNQPLRPPSAHMASHLTNHSSMVTRVTIVLLQGLRRVCSTIYMDGRAVGMIISRSIHCLGWLQHIQNRYSMPNSAFPNPFVLQAIRIMSALRILYSVLADCCWIRWLDRPIQGLLLWSASPAVMASLSPRKVLAFVVVRFLFPHSHARPDLKTRKRRVRGCHQIQTKANTCWGPLGQRQ